MWEEFPSLLDRLSRFKVGKELSEQFLEFGDVCKNEYGGVGCVDQFGECSHNPLNEGLCEVRAGRRLCDVFCTVAEEEIGGAREFEHINER